MEQPQESRTELRDETAVAALQRLGTQFQCTFLVQEKLLTSKYIMRLILASHSLISLGLFVFPPRAVLRSAAINVAFSFITCEWSLPGVCAYLN